MATAGTALVAMTAKSFGVPVLICCESIKFTEKVFFLLVDRILSIERITVMTLVMNGEI